MTLPLAPGVSRNSDCRFLEPMQGWRFDPLTGKSSEEMILGYNCQWADAHPAQLLHMPAWLQSSMIAAMAHRPKHCDGCRCYEPEDPAKL